MRNWGGIVGCVGRVVVIGGLGGVGSDWGLFLLFMKGMCDMGDCVYFMIGYFCIGRMRWFGIGAHGRLSCIHI